MMISVWTHFLVLFEPTGIPNTISLDSSLDEDAMLASAFGSPKVGGDMAGIEKSSDATISPAKSVMSPISKTASKFKHWKQAFDEGFENEVYFLSGWKEALTLSEVKNRINKFDDDSRKYVKDFIVDQKESSKALDYAQDLLNTVFEWRKMEEDGDQIPRLEREKDLIKKHFDGYFPYGWESVNRKELKNRLKKFNEYGEDWTGSFGFVPHCKEEAKSFLSHLTKVVDDHIL